ncbi:hypothetical protein CLV92_1269 [Kineococcus xinjiangensis]|uniref:Uncharacterized protein n=1 Tax=Kineococcus xinjiangensis TaxID=512762 RepID=A0A2S6IC41_9ACTN|nr:hypothetical protein [Kineococcus xinjiangensis]PPK90200.1 hypothetical protein CLV92_1269 [Kineococcus xinjiangensis]
MSHGDHLVRAQMQAAIAAVQALAPAPHGPLIAITPAGVWGNPWEGHRFDGADIDDHALVIRLGGGHLILRLQAPRLLAHEHDYVILEAEHLTQVITPYGGGTQRSQSWDDAHLRLTWNPDRALQDWGPQGPIEDTP